jgi:hypothetical protein
MALEQVEELAEVEARHHDDRRALRETEVDDDRLAVDVEERQRADKHVVLVDAVHRADLLEVGDEVAVREHHALGHTGRPARERQRGEVGAGVEVGLPRRVVAGRQRLERIDAVDARAGHRRAQRLCGDHRLGVGLRELGGDLARRQQRVDRADYPAERGDRVERDRPVEAVRREQGDGVAVPDPVGREPGRDRLDPRGKLGVGHHRPADRVDQRRLVATPGRAAEHVPAERDVGDRDVWIRARERRHGATLVRRRRSCAGRAGGRPRPWPAAPRLPRPLAAAGPGGGGRRRRR